MIRSIDDIKPQLENIIQRLEKMEEIPEDLVESCSRPGDCRLRGGDAGEPGTEPRPPGNAFKPSWTEGRLME